MSDVSDLAKSYEVDVVSSLENEIKKLKQMNEQLSAQVKELSIRGVSPEELICVEQIQVLQNRSAQRELSLEEVKKLDLLIKNLRLIKEQSTENISSSGTRDVTEVDLVAIATRQS